MADQVVNAMLDAVRKHAGNAAQSDDIAMPMIKYQGSDFYFDHGPKRNKDLALGRERRP